MSLDLSAQQVGTKIQIHYIQQLHYTINSFVSVTNEVEKNEVNFDTYSTDNRGEIFIWVISATKNWDGNSQVGHYGAQIVEKLLHQIQEYLQSMIFIYSMLLPYHHKYYKFILFLLCYISFSAPAQLQSVRRWISSFLS